MRLKTVPKAFEMAPAEEAEVRTFVEAATYSNTDPTNGKWPALARTGVIQSVNGTLDLDLGVQARLNASATRFSWLAGATWHW